MKGKLSRNELEQRVDKVGGILLIILLVLALLSGIYYSAVLLPSISFTDEQQQVLDGVTKIAQENPDVVDNITLLLDDYPLNVQIVDGEFRHPADSIGNAIFNSFIYSICFALIATVTWAILFAICKKILVGKV